MVQRADISNVLSEIRNLRSQMQQQSQQMDRIQPAEGLKGGIDRVQENKAPGFSNMLRDAVDHVNGLQKQSSDLSTRYEQGDPNVDLTQVMIASQKSSVSFEALSQVRNRVVRAYEDIMKMAI